MELYCQFSIPYARNIAQMMGLPKESFKHFVISDYYNNEPMIRINDSVSEMFDFNVFDALDAYVDSRKFPEYKDIYSNYLNLLTELIKKIAHLHYLQNNSLQIEYTEACKFFLNQSTSIQMINSGEFDIANDETRQLLFFRIINILIITLNFILGTNENELISIKKTIQNKPIAFFKDYKNYDFGFVLLLAISLVESDGSEDSKIFDGILIKSDNFINLGIKYLQQVFDNQPAAIKNQTKSSKIDYYDIAYPLIGPMPSFVKKLKQ